MSRRGVRAQDIDEIGRAGMVELNEAEGEASGCLALHLVTAGREQHAQELLIAQPRGDAVPPRDPAVQDADFAHVPARDRELRTLEGPLRRAARGMPGAR